MCSIGRTRRRVGALAARRRTRPRRPPRPLRDPPHRAPRAGSAAAAGAPARVRAARASPGRARSGTRSRPPRSRGCARRTRAAAPPPRPHRRVRWRPCRLGLWRTGGRRDPRLHRTLRRRRHAVVEDAVESAAATDGGFGPSSRSPPACVSGPRTMRPPEPRSGSTRSGSAWERVSDVSVGIGGLCAGGRLAAGGSRRAWRTACPSPEPRSGSALSPPRATTTSGRQRRRQPAPSICTSPAPPPAAPAARPRPSSATGRSRRHRPSGTIAP